MQGSLASWKKTSHPKWWFSSAPGPEDGTVSSPGAPIAWRLRPMAALCAMQNLGRFSRFFGRKSHCIYMYLHVNIRIHSLFGITFIFSWLFIKHKIRLQLSEQNIGPLKLQRLPRGRAGSGTQRNFQAGKKHGGFQVH